MAYRSPYLGTDEFKKIRKRLRKRGKLEGLNREQRQKRITKAVDRMIANTDKLPPNAYMAEGGMASKKGYSKGGMVKANCGASMKPNRMAKK